MSMEGENRYRPKRDVSEIFLNSSPTEFKDAVGTESDLKLVLHQKDADPVSIKDFLQVSGREVVIRSTGEEYETFGHLYPPGIKWELAE